MVSVMMYFGVFLEPGVWAVGPTSTCTLLYEDAYVLR